MSIFKTIGSYWGPVGTVVGAALDNQLNKHNARSAARQQNQATLDMYSSAPSYQMEGFRRAGLNPMLAYSRMDFPSGSASVQTFPSGFSQSFAAGVQAQAASQQADTAAEVGSASSAKMRQETETEKFRTAVQRNESIKGNYALQQLAGTLDAAMKVTNAANAPEAIAKLEEPRIRAGLAELRAAFASATNDAQVYEALNSKAVNIALDVLGRVTGMGTAINGAVDRYRARSQRGDIINLNKD